MMRPAAERCSWVRCSSSPGGVDLIHAGQRVGGLDLARHVVDGGGEIVGIAEQIGGDDQEELTAPSDRDIGGVVAAGQGAGEQVHHQAESAALVGGNAAQSGDHAVEAVVGIGGGLSLGVAEAPVGGDVASFGAGAHDLAQGDGCERHIEHDGRS